MTNKIFLKVYSRNPSENTTNSRLSETDTVSNL